MSSVGRASGGCPTNPIENVSGSFATQPPVFHPLLHPGADKIENVSGSFATRPTASELSEQSEHSELCFHNFYIGYVRCKWFDYVCHKENSYLVLHKPAPYPHHHQSWGDFDVCRRRITDMVSERGSDTSGIPKKVNLC